MISEGTGLPVPRSVRAVDSILMHPAKLYTHVEFERQQSALDKQRADFIDKFPSLNKKVKAVFQK
jgi:ATP-dependent phosphoenolpyruvate carboxykinase